MSILSVSVSVCADREFSLFDLQKAWSWGLAPLTDAQGYVKVLGRERCCVVVFNLYVSMEADIVC